MATSYTNPCGSGNRSTQVLVTASFVTGYPTSDWVDGNLAQNTAYFGTVSNFILEFWFPSKKIIDEAKFYQSTAASHGTFKWQGSNDRTTWTDIGGTFTLGGVATQTLTTLAGNTTAYIFYRLVQTAGTTSSSPWIYEFEFKIDEGPGSTTSYLNPLGSGDRTTTIVPTSSGITWLSTTIAALLNGVRVAGASEVWWQTDATNAGDWIQFDLGAAYVVQQARWWTDQVTAQGTWKLQGSLDSTAWTDISATVTLQGASTFAPFVTCFGGGESNTTAYRYYRILGVSGGRSSSPYELEVEFLVAAAGGGVDSVVGATRPSTAAVFSGSVAFDPAPLVVTQLAAELLRLVPNSPLAATQVAAEILFASANALRVEQLACELLIIPRRVRFTCPVDFPTDPI